METNETHKVSDRALAGKLVEEIDRLTRPLGRKVRYMEVCGTHTVSIFRAGLRQLLPPQIELVSGPGCPVCVTPDSYMDKAIAYAKELDTIIATFGDMLKVPGSESSLSEAMAAGADIRVVYSPLDSLKIAKENPNKTVIFLAVGFETTAPTAAAAVIAAKRAGLKNLFMLSAQKLIPPAMKLLLDDERTNVDGFLLPGHVAVVTGSDAFLFLARDYHKPGVVAGFEAVEILRAIYRLAQMTTAGEARVENEYDKVVSREGNGAAQRAMYDVYEAVDTPWRGLGDISASGLRMRDEWQSFDIERVRPIEVNVKPSKAKSLCRCGEVLKGQIVPQECPLFAKACVPEHAIGPCMVSVEGVCAAHYKYGGGKFKYGA